MLRLYAEAVARCRQDAVACGQRVARRNELLTAEAVADAIAAAPDRRLSAAAVREELTFFFRELLKRQPGLIGGRLPDDSLYLGKG